MTKKDALKLDQQDSDGQTPLIHAVLLSNLSIVQLLLDNGVSVNITDKVKPSSLNLLVRTQCSYARSHAKQCSHP